MSTANLGQLRRDRRYHVVIPAKLVRSYYLYISSKAFINNNHTALTTIQLLTYLQN